MAFDFTELAKWFSFRHSWLQDAARRLFQAGELSGADLAELLILCKREAGIIVDDLPSLVAMPILATALDISGTGVPLRLNELSDIKGINALAPRRPLTFSKAHITVVFGSNGTGKSGYIRILKHMCGGRGLRKLHHNVFHATKAEQGCKVKYMRGTALMELDWSPAVGVHSDLSGISLFDNECANVYINHENEVAYEPTLLSYFRRLVEICEHLSAALKGEVLGKTSAKPILPRDYTLTASGRWYAAIQATTTNDDVDQYCKWNPLLETELAAIFQRLSEANPAEKARAIRKTRGHVHDLLTLLQKLEAIMGDESLSQLLAARADRAAKRRAADEDATKVFDKSPLGGVASETWQLLWEKARLYSEMVAYPGKTYPNTDHDARCVLCQQPLDAESRQRLTAFEAFIKGSLESDAKASDTALAAIVAKISDVPIGEELDAKLDVATIADDAFRGEIREHFALLKVRRDAILAAQVPCDVHPIPVSLVAKKLAELEAMHETDSAAYDEDAKRDNKNDLTEKVRNLQCQKWLSEQKVAVLTEIARLQEIALLEKAQRLTNTKSLSEKKTELAELLITAAFVKRFEDELKLLGASRLKVTIEKTRTTKGQVWHRVCLKDKDDTLPIMMSEVLSDGELRIVSIAAFLADVAINQDNAAFIFDDPISSLDQDFEESTASRLACMSKTRQVIVFTHRLSLIHLIEEIAKKQGVDCDVVSLQREAWGAGEPSDPPLPAQKPKQALNALISDRFAKARKVWMEQGTESYQVHAKALCSDLRITIERLIEHELLADVVQRFRRPITTMGKIEKLAKIKTDDCKLFDDLMTKYSRYEHAQPDEAPVPLPEPDELETDLTTLKTWLDSFSSRPIPLAAS